MSKKKDRIAREKAEKRKAWLKENRDLRKKVKEMKEVQIKSSFKKPKQVNKRLIDSLFTVTLTDQDPESSNPEDRITKDFFYHLLRIINENNKKKQRINRYRELLAELTWKSPKLLEDRFWMPLWLLTSIDWLLSPGEWVPRGRGSGTLFISLVNHLVVRFHMPGFLYSVFFLQEETVAEQMIRFFTCLARGGSLYRAVKTGLIPIKLTKRMCYYFLSSPADTGVFEAFRNAQVKAYGGERRLAHTLSSTILGRGFMEDEAFWLTVIMWFCKHSMLDPALVGPLIDFISHKKGENTPFSIAGRSVLAMIRDMKIWHGDLVRERKQKGIIYNPSGFKEGIWEIKGKLPDGKSKIFIWTMEEILNSKDLAEEGKKMSHCVYSYHSQIITGKVSIWSLRKEGERRLTVEVSKGFKTIYQARGKYNWLPKAEELSVLKRWAVENLLKVKLMEW